MSEHLTNEQLQLFVDSVAAADERVRIESHLQSCARCRHAYEGLMELDASLKSLPVERTSADFTRNVLAQLNIAPKTPFLFRVVENLAYVFGLIIVVGIMLTVFLATGVINKSQVTETQSTVSNAGKIVGQQLESMTSGLTVFLQTYLPFLFGSGSMKIALMCAVALGMIALLDTFLKRRILR